MSQSKAFAKVALRAETRQGGVRKLSVCAVAAEGSFSPQCKLTVCATPPDSLVSSGCLPTKDLNLFRQQSIVIRLLSLAILLTAPVFAAASAQEYAERLRQ